MNKKIIAFIGILLFASPMRLRAQEHNAIVAVPDINRILIIWNTTDYYPGYNLYRRTSGTDFIRVNDDTIRLIEDCTSFRNFLHKDSSAYRRLWSVVPEMCDIPQIMASKRDRRRYAIKAAAFSNIYIAIAIGQGFIDSSVVNGTRYFYALRGVDSSGVETEILCQTSVVAGNIRPPARPTGVELIPGDASIMIRWRPVTGAVGYIVERKKAGTGTFIRINYPTTMSKCVVGPAGDTLSDTTKLCFLDYMRWDHSKPTSISINGIYFKGPFPGTTYVYRVKAFDIAGRFSPPSITVSGTSYDSTAPQSPTSIHVAAIGDSFNITWEKVVKDYEGHIDLSGVKGYKVYRYTSIDDTIGTLVTSLVPQPSDTTVLNVSYKDTTHGLGSPYQDKGYFYRIKTIDNWGNESNLSAHVGGVIKDKTPPPPPTNLRAHGRTNSIALEWKKVSTPDVAGYLIYRGICGDTLLREKIRIIYPMHLVGTVDNEDSTSFIDRTVPSGSPVCYRYTVKAYDNSQNLSDTSKTVCERLRERVAPPPPLIVGLKARDGAILVQWVAPPVQDLFGFIVERADTSDTTVWDTLTKKLRFPTTVKCESLPSMTIWAQDTIFSFVDSTAKAKEHYFYRVRCADVGGNVSAPSASVGTFTFSFKFPTRPHIRRVTPASDGLIIKWTPAYDSTLLGFLVFRSENPTTGYIQISPLIRSDHFKDKLITKGKTYWYKVQALHKSGNRSVPSAAKSGKLP